ncbi:hypothetical protein PISMIDRAFT_440232 [Pisolithus microcarpus 441]|uniref:Unplaced genomic scaffold scaffold_4, whole genome shotgun sequence n=1 Tax=Pisolithus microcarpus 441 TaxID=765257 RepID=A0A0C9YX80_9AGAM|nr:hypothetical protein PISMIDRAFT_440232 [Pisolithus microcarpus 441]
MHFLPRRAGSYLSRTLSSVAGRIHSFEPGAFMRALVNIQLDRVSRIRCMSMRFTSTRMSICRVLHSFPAASCPDYLGSNTYARVVFSKIDRLLVGAGIHKCPGVCTSDVVCSCILQRLGFAASDFELR